MKSPFKFLDPYELKDYQQFFGRKTETKELYNLVTKNRLTFVYGPSGTGKTSLVQCGLAHRFGGTDWLPLFIRRGADINVTLRQEIGKALGEKSYEGEIEAGIQTLYRRFYRPVYLIFDQFEELFILSDSDREKERLPFYETIADILDTELPCRLLFIMREDYFGHLNEFEQVVPELYHRKIRVEPMNRENLLEVITGSCEVHHIGFGESRKDPVRILDKMQTDKAGTHMPHVQVYLHMLWQEAQKQQGENVQQRLTFNEPIIESVGEIKDVLGRFLSEQKVVIQKKLIADGLQPSEEVVAAVLDVFVSDDGTKIPIPYTKIADQQNLLTGKFANRLAKLDPRLVAACLNELEYARVLRRSEDDYEIAHDTLAAIVNQQRSAEQRQLREVERRIELGYREHQESKQSAQLYFFDAGQLARIEPFLNKAILLPECKKFITESEKEIKLIQKEKEKIQEEELTKQRRQIKREKKLKELAEREKKSALISMGMALKASMNAEKNEKKAKFRTRLATFLSILALATAGFALCQYQDAQNKTEEALSAKDNAVLEKKRADSLATLAQAETDKALQSAAAETAALAKADSNLVLAKNNEQNAKKSARDAKKALVNLQVANIKSVELILREADRNIFQLDYEAALEKVQAAYQLGVNLLESKKRLQEIAFVYTETEQWEKVDTCLQLMNIKLTKKDRTTALQQIKAIDLAHDTFLQQRYYPEMVLIEGGIFKMGCNITLDQNCKEDEIWHRQEISDYKLAKYETTWWQYNLFCLATGHKYESPNWGRQGNNPVVNVHWFDAVLYTNWLSNHFALDTFYILSNKHKISRQYYYDITLNEFSKGFRLPTEAEWEYASKGGINQSSFIFSGNHEIDSIAWYAVNGGSRTHPVGTKNANSLGVYDMSGNVLEWCHDWYGDYINSSPKDYKGIKDGSHRVLRGGGWSNLEIYCRVSHRSDVFPLIRSSDGGFRIVCIK